jgi:23S rRNA pseudouridine2605 synthase
MRLNKFLAHCGVASRRACDELIFNGKVSVNGVIVKNPAYRVNIDKDVVKIDQEEIKFEKKIYILLNKPHNVLSTVKDNFNRKTIIDLIKDITERIYPVGRLDYDVEGAIILTNDGELANKLIHPRYKVEKEYIAIVKGLFTNAKKLALENGVIIENKRTLPAKCEILSSNKNQSKVKLIITEGRKRQVKKMFKHVGNEVIKLKRTRFGPISLGDLPAGKWRHLTNGEVDLLKMTTLKFTKRKI